jgi:large conductance mechanosensitive channel
MVTHKSSHPERRREMLKEFKEFAMRGNVVDMAVGIIIGAAFGSIVKSLVADVIMPPIGLLLGNVDFSNLFSVIKQGSVAGPFATVADAQKAGAVTINYGMFINTIISFLIVAFAVFLLIRGINSLKRKEEAPPEEPTTKECPHCFSEISIKATRCAFCAADIPSP